MSTKTNATKTQAPATNNDRLARMKQGAKLAGYTTVGVAGLGVLVGLSALGNYAMTSLGQKIWSAI